MIRKTKDFGKTLGGSSSINAMLYVRGHRWDYDHWSELGNEGWSYDEILPYFKKAEHNESFDNDYHGQNGPLNVMKIRHQNTPTDDFVKTGAEIFGYNEDFNGENQEGVGALESAALSSPISSFMPSTTSAGTVIFAASWSTHCCA